MAYPSRIRAQGTAQISSDVSRNEHLWGLQGFDSHVIHENGGFKSQHGVSKPYGFRYRFGIRYGLERRRRETAAVSKARGKAVAEWHTVKNKLGRRDGAQRKELLKA